MQAVELESLWAERKINFVKPKSSTWVEPHKKKEENSSILPFFGWVGILNLFLTGLFSSILNFKIHFLFVEIPQKNRP